MKITAFQNPKIHTVIAGLSGGADSVAMVLAYKQCGIKIYAVHCNFHLRGEESDRDQLFVENFCQQQSIPLYKYDFDVYGYIKGKNISVEMACRDLRYSKFRELKKQHHADRIAVAHNADDNVETFFLNLMRGAGVSGLRGMKSDTGEIIRPLLNVWREEILLFLEENGQDFIVDSSNLETEYQRNFIRNEVIPLIEKRWPEAKRSINRSIHNLQEEEKILDSLENNFIKDQSFLSYDYLNKFPEPLWLIRRYIASVGGNFTQAKEIYASIRNKEFVSGKKWLVNDGKIIAERDGLEFVPLKQWDFKVISETMENTETLRRQIFQAPLSEFWTTLPENRIMFRPADNCDRIDPLGMTGSMLVSKIMKDAKLTQSEKERTVVAVDIKTSKVLWVEGLKRSRHFLVNNNEKVYSYRIKKFDINHGNGKQI